MPGIVGLITKFPKEVAERQLREMVRSICHETFYTSGTWTDSAQGVYVGWVAQENSFSSDMPVHNEAKDVSLIFSGQEFSGASVRDGLKQRGHHVEPEGPSYLIHSYEEDSSFPASLNGHFHGL